MIKSICKGKVKFMYQELINKIKENTILDINEKIYKVVSKVFYTVKSDSEVEYVKCKLDTYDVLVIIPDELVYLGKVIDNMQYEEIENGKILYNGKEYISTGSDYQLAKKIEFGNKVNTEGECQYWDYENEDTNTIISLAILTENNKRADILANIIDIKDIKIVNF